MYLNRISAYLSVLAVYYISYIPFLFIFPYLGVDKIILFIIIALLNLSLILIAELPRAITGCIGFRKQNVLALCLYLVFALYTLCSYAVIGEFLNDVFTLRTLTLVNPIFVLFAISCLGNKKEVIIATFLFSFVYFAFLIQSMVQGDIQTGQMNILGTVFDMEERLDAYQNVNMYLGLFIISALYFMSRERAFYSIIAILSIILSIIGMFLIGGRASIVAVAVVILLYVWKSTIRGRRLGLSPTR